MNPSYNNSFGSFSSGGAEGQPGMVSPGPDASPIIIGEKKSRKWVWALVVFLFIGISIGVAVGISVVGNLNEASVVEKIKESLASNRDDISYLENIYYHIYSGEISYLDAFESSDSRDTMRSWLVPLEDLWAGIKDIESIKVVPEGDASFLKLKEMVANRLEVYERGAELYASLYDIYYGEDIIDDENLADIVEVFHVYREKEAQILVNMDLNDCSSQYDMTEICLSLYNEYIDSADFVTNGEHMADVFLDVLGSINYSEDGWISDVIDEVSYLVGRDLDNAGVVDEE